VHAFADMFDHKPGTEDTLLHARPNLVEKSHSLRSGSLHVKELANFHSEEQHKVEHHQPLNHGPPPFHTPVVASPSPLLPPLSPIKDNSQPPLAAAPLPVVPPPSPAKDNVQQPLAQSPTKDTTPAPSKINSTSQGVEGTEIDASATKEEEEDSDDDDIPELVDVKATAAAAAAEEAEDRGSTRGEKKTRKTILRLGLKQVPGVIRVTIKKSKHCMFLIKQPDVFKSSDSCYIVFGEAKIEDLKQKQAELDYKQSQAQQQEAQARQYMRSGGRTAQGAMGESTDDVDAGDMDEKDIALVIDQAHCTRAHAVAALNNNNNDLVNAIMELTM
jgi:nascent polypeptide-associated complex subunit alpha